MIDDDDCIATEYVSCWRAGWGSRTWGVRFSESETWMRYGRDLCLTGLQSRGHHFDS